MQLSPGAGALQTDASLPGLCRRPTRAHGPTPLSARRVGIPANVSLLDGRIQRAGRGSAWALGWRWRRRRGTPWSLAWSGRLARNNWLRPRALCSRGQGWLGRQPLPRRAPLDLPSLSGRLASVCLSRHGCVIPCSSCVRKAGALWGRLPEVWPLGHGAPHGVEDPLSSEPPGGPRSLQGCCSVRVRGCLMRSGGLLLGASAAAG